MTRPLPEDVARTARAYLAALVPPDEVSDAWHELVADATYWGDRELVEVVRLAHQVVLQHQPVTPQVAVLALRDVGLDQPSVVAGVLDVDEDTTHGWTREVAASVEGGPGADVVGRFSGPTRPAPVEAVPPGPGPGEAGSAAPATSSIDPDEAAGSADSGDAVRIGFDQDGPAPVLDHLDSPASAPPRRGMVVATVVLAVLLALAVWLLGR